MVDRTEEEKPKRTEQRKSPKVHLSGVIELCKSNIGDTVAYIVLAISLFYTFFSPLIGGLIVGFILGLYFSPHIFSIAGRFREFLLTDGIFKSFTLIAAVVAFFISAPGMAIGLLLGSVIKPVFVSKSEPPPPEDTDTTSPEQ